MNTFLKSFCASVALLGSASSFAATAPLETVDYVDLFAYQGTWYGIARFEQPYIRPNCVGSTATYTIRGDGNVDVLNQCRLNDPVSGPLQATKGIASPQDSSNSRLSVQFFPGTPPGQYWIMELDDAYQYVMVGNPKRDALFILSRQPTLDSEIYQELIEEAQEQGFDTSKLIQVVQPK